MNSRPMIAVDGRPFVGGYSGYTTYLLSIIEPLAARGFEVTLLSNRTLNPVFNLEHNYKVVVFGSSLSSLWEQVDVPTYLQQHKTDAYFVGTNKGLPWRKAKHTRYILGLLDIIPYKFPRGYFSNPRFVLRELRPIAQLMSVWRADALITISEQSARDIRALFHRRAEPLLLRLPQSKKPDAPAKWKPQFSYVGGVDKRKQLASLLRAFAAFQRSHSGYRLVLIGHGYEAFNALISELGIAGDVVMTGYIDSDSKMKVLAESAALVYPSLYEGYGLAIAEGFMAGVPVVAGSGGSQSEIGGGGVLYVDPTSPAEIATAMEQVLNPDVRASLEAGRKQQMPKLFGEGVESAIGDFFAKQVQLARRQE